MTTPAEKSALTDTARGEQLETEVLLELYRRMLRIRGFESRASVLYGGGEIPGFVHLSIGQEAAAVGACWPLRESDVITSNHRGHGHVLAKGLDPAGMFAELLGRDAGTCHGRGGSMHIADPGLGIFGANGIVGAGLPIAAGAATAAQLRDDNSVVLAFFGDGTVAQGAFHEAVNLAALWKLPLILLCENNHYAEFSAADEQNPVALATRAAGYGLEYVGVVGNDVEAVAHVMQDVVERVREDARPIVVEADTYRWHGHYEGDPMRYRSDEELDEWKLRDPLLIAAAGLRERGAEEGQLDEIAAEIESELEEALAWARAQEPPDPSTLLEFAYAPREEIADRGLPSGEPYRTMDAIRGALRHELEHDPSVFLAGVDIGAGGGVFAITRGLQGEFPDRVRDTPISELAVVGLGVGSAMAGFRPVLELMFFDFIGVCFDQLLNQAAKLRFMTGGRASVPLTMRTQFGGSTSAGSQHSQSLEALLAHIPGLTVLMPSTPADTYGLLRAAIRDPNPVIFIENRQLYGLTGPAPTDPEHLVPIGKSAVARTGADVTVVAASRMVHESLAAAETLAGEGYDVEVIDLRSIVPLDREAILASVAKTSRALVVHEAVRDFGIGAEVAALIADQAFWDLDAPVRRLGGPHTPVPYAPSLERVWVPDAERIAAELRELLAV
jgi:2-oxoisovalerate dehydrogenase E1 component